MSDTFGYIIASFVIVGGIVYILLYLWVDNAKRLARGNAYNDKELLKGRARQAIRNSLVERQAPYIQHLQQEEVWQREDENEKRAKQGLEPLGPIVYDSHLLLLPGVVITYTANQEKFAFIDKQIQDLLAAQPKLDLYPYQRKLGIEIWKIDTGIPDEPKRPIGFYT